MLCVAYAEQSTPRFINLIRAVNLRSCKYVWLAHGNSAKIHEQRSSDLSEADTVTTACFELKEDCARLRAIRTLINKWQRMTLDGWSFLTSQRGRTQRKNFYRSKIVNRDNASESSRRIHQQRGKNLRSIYIGIKHPVPSRSLSVIILLISMYMRPLQLLCPVDMLFQRQPTFKDDIDRVTWLDDLYYTTSRSSCNSRQKHASVPKTRHEGQSMEKRLLNA